MRPERRTMSPSTRLEALSRSRRLVSGEATLIGDVPLDHPVAHYSILVQALIPSEPVSGSSPSLRETLLRFMIRACPYGPAAQKSKVTLHSVRDMYTSTRNWNYARLRYASEPSLWEPPSPIDSSVRCAAFSFRLFEPAIMSLQSLSILSACSLHRPATVQWGRTSS